MNAMHLVANPWQSHDPGVQRWVFSFLHGSVRVLVYALPDKYDTAMDLAAEWCEDNAEGVFCDDEVAAEYDRLRRTPYGGPMDNSAMRDAEADTFCAGSASRRISSEGSTILAENATREELPYLLGLGDEDE